MIKMYLLGLVCVEQVAGSVDWRNSFREYDCWSKEHYTIVFVELDDPEQPIEQYILVDS